MSAVKIAIYGMHPIPYQAPIFKKAAQHPKLDVTVLYGDSLGVELNFIPGFNTELKWDVPLLDGYRHIFFKNYSRKRITGFFSRVNPGIFWYIVRTDFRVLLIHGHFTFTAWLAFFAGKISGKKIIIRGEAIPKKDPISKKKALGRYFLSIYLSATDAVMYSCSRNKSYWLSLKVPEEKMFFLSCAVDNAYLQKERQRLLPGREKMRISLGIGSNDFVVLFCARFTNRKRPLDLIDAVASLGLRNIVILFVGDGPERQNMELASQKKNIRAVFTGFVNQSQLPRYYNVANCYAILSEYDASPKTLNEALNFGLPIICSNMVGTSDDLVIHEHNGFMVKVGDIHNIGECLKSLSKSRPLALKMGKFSEVLVRGWNFEQNVKAIFRSCKFALSKSN
jgi:glycosyltransferase involved in cell wall biosynthesis